MSISCDINKKNFKILLVSFWVVDMGCINIISDLEQARKLKIGNCVYLKRIHEYCHARVTFRTSFYF